MFSGEYDTPKWNVLGKTSSDTFQNSYNQFVITSTLLKCFGQSSYVCRPYQITRSMNRWYYLTWQIITHYAGKLLRIWITSLNIVRCVASWNFTATVHLPSRPLTFTHWCYSSNVVSTISTFISGVCSLLFCLSLSSLLDLYHNFIIGSVENFLLDSLARLQFTLAWKYV